jgi:hypothetical protein
MRVASTAVLPQRIATVPSSLEGELLEFERTFCATVED